MFVMARLRGDRTDSMRGSLRAGPHRWDAVYTLNGELYRTQWCATETAARADLATHQDALAAAGWTLVAVSTRADRGGGGGGGRAERMADTRLTLLFERYRRAYSPNSRRLKAYRIQASSLTGMLRAVRS